MFVKTKEVLFHYLKMCFVVNKKGRIFFNSQLAPNIPTKLHPHLPKAPIKVEVSIKNSILLLDKQKGGGLFLFFFPGSVFSIAFMQQNCLCLSCAMRMNVFTKQPVTQQRCPWKYITCYQTLPFSLRKELYQFKSSFPLKHIDASPS